MIRRYLLAGLFTLLPMVVTIWILRWIFDALIGIFRAPLVLVYSALNLPAPGYWTLAFFSAIATIILLMLVGALVGNFVGKQLLLWMDELMLHVPVVKGVYGATNSSSE